MAQEASPEFVKRLITNFASPIFVAVFVLHRPEKTRRQMLTVLSLIRAAHCQSATAPPEPTATDGPD